MNFEILYFDGCRTHQTAEKKLREVVMEQGSTADVELLSVNTDDEAAQLKFPGSPTIRVDGRDLFPTVERQDYRVGCRVYTTPEGLKGYPNADMLREAIENL